MKWMGSVLPPISKTERVALEAGTVWLESEFFSGRPDIKKFLNLPEPELTKEEQDFLDGPTEELCKMSVQWDIWKKREISEDVKTFIKENKFFGMIIPKKYGGLGFSALAHAKIIEKITSRDTVVGVTVMVPNSLGPAELLLMYGTEKQKDYYLPRLASGKEIPCFGLTEPTAGSDAGAIQSEGIVFKNDQGEICIRLNWNKRWITLSGEATLIGIAFQLKDPDHILGDKERLGITLALIPSTTEGIIRGRRHDPMGISFNNCPIQGKNVVIKADETIIGGLQNVGRGWEMLMSCLSIGRGISLPSQACGALKTTFRVTSAFSLVRRQFGTSIRHFEGIQEQLAPILSSCYSMEALRNLTMRALVDDIVPPVLTSITKYHTTEKCRQSLIRGMDILGGAGISMGPRNSLALHYIGLPISITVEGANILTRTFMLFGQGALRAHPYIYKEIRAIEEKNLKDFDQLFFKHMGHIFFTAVRSFVLNLTRGYFITPTGYAPKEVRRYVRHLYWVSSSFAFMSNVVMILLGGKLKSKEKISARYGDILSSLHIVSAVLWRYEKEGRRKEDLPLVHYACQENFWLIQKAFEGIYKNFPQPVFKLFFQIFYVWTRLNQIEGVPSDDLGKKVCQIAFSPEQRDRLTQNIFVPKEDSFYILEKTYKQLLETQPLRDRIKQAVRKKEIPRKKPFFKQIPIALEHKVITEEESRKLLEVEDLRSEAIQVDDFSDEEFFNRA